LQGDLDYRLRLLQQAGTFLTPADAAADARLRSFFTDVAPGPAVEQRRIEINGREISTLRCAKGVAWFDFVELCEGPRSQQDYIEIARWYQTVIVSGIPLLTAAREDAARRFIALVDEFYDRRVKLIVSAVCNADQLYQGTRLGFEYQRTISRLTEMQSQQYLHAPHRA
jgi:cell division protein ZapE